MPRFDYVHDVVVTEIACALPRQQLKLYEYMSNLLTEKSCQRLIKSTGFSSLRIAPEGMTAADLFEAAAKQILSEDKGIGALIFVTQTPDYAIPATSHILQDRLGLGHNVICLDINEGCPGFIVGLYVAASLCQRLQTRVLLGCGDTVSKITAPNDRATRCVFGDGAAAILVEPGTQNIPFAFESYGERAEVIMAKGSGTRFSNAPDADGLLHFNGMEIINFTLNDVYDLIVTLRNKEHLMEEDISLYICHQANRLLFDGLVEKLGISPEKMPFTAGEIGNQSSASIPFVLTSLQEKNLDSHQTLCCGFGTGLSAGACIVDFSKTKIHTTVEI